jgi:precorrin-4 methylase
MIMKCVHLSGSIEILHRIKALNSTYLKKYVENTPENTVFRTQWNTQNVVDRRHSSITIKVHSEMLIINHIIASDT